MTLFWKLSLSALRMEWKNNGRRATSRLVLAVTVPLTTVEAGLVVNMTWRMLRSRLLITRFGLLYLLVQCNGHRALRMLTIRPRPGTRFTAAGHRGKGSTS